MLGYHPPRTRKAPPRPGRHPLGPGTPPAPGRHPPGAEHTGRYGQPAGGMHPTGMQSCVTVVFLISQKQKQKKKQEK